MRFDLLGHRACLAGIAGLLLAAPAASAADPVFTEFTGGITPNSLPSSVVLGPDGNLWMGEARAPGRIAKVAPRSMVVPGTLEEWREWTGLPFDETGPVLVPRALTPVLCDVEHGVATYVEPNVWVVHRTER